MTSAQRRFHTAGTYFASGDFERSEAAGRELWDAGIRTPGLSALLGEILLLRNRPAEADPLLERAVIAQGGTPRLLALLAECRRRSGDLAAAALLYRQLGRGGLADKLTLLADSGQYLFPAGAEIQVPWPSHSELPLVEARVNGTAGHFLLDTGVGETLIDPALARVAGLRPLGVEAIHLPSGPAGRVEHTVIDALGLGEVSVERVPAHVHPTRDVFANLLPFQVDGILGVGLFSRIPTTLDYVGRQLRMGAAERTAAGVPFYLAGDQYPLVRTRINDRFDTLLFLDTGMIGAAIGLPFSSAEEAEVEVARDIAGAGFGIASEMQARPFLCRSVEAAGARRNDLPGMLIGQFRLEHQFGFHIGGLLGDGFVQGGVLTLDFQNMRLSYGL